MALHICGVVVLSGKDECVAKGQRSRSTEETTKYRYR